MGVITDERDDVIRALTRHCGDGRLTLDELEERISEAYEATTDADLHNALRDLPMEAPAIRIDPAPPRVSVSAPPEWEKTAGTAFCIGGFVLLFNGMFIMAMICWFVLPGLVLKHRGRSA